MVEIVNIDGVSYDVSSVIKKIDLNGIIYNIGLDTFDATALTSDILLGKTAYVNGQKITGSIKSQSAQTITPGTTNKTISSGLYLNGTQTIKGDSNLKSSNIKSGVSIFGVAGNIPPGSIVEGIITVTRFNGTYFWKTANINGQWTNQTLKISTSGTLYWKKAEGGYSAITTINGSIASGTKVASGATITFSASGGDHSCSAAVVYVKP